jgi:hypothetical protein
MSKMQRDEIESNITHFIETAGTDEDMHSVICDFVEEVQDEAIGVPMAERKAPVRATDAAVAIEVYDLFIEGMSEVAGEIPKQVAYHIASNLLRNYEFYEKENK